MPTSHKIGFVISNNCKNLTRYFEDIKSVADFVHAEEIVQSPSQFSGELIKQIL